MIIINTLINYNTEVELFIDVEESLAIGSSRKVKRILVISACMIDHISLASKFVFWSKERIEFPMNERLFIILTHRSNIASKVVPPAGGLSSFENSGISRPSSNSTFFSLRAKAIVSGLKIVLISVRSPLFISSTAF